MVLAIALAAYLALWPVPIEPVSWKAPAGTGFTGAYQPNTKLVDAKSIVLNGEIGPEHVIEGPDGKLYVSVVSGKILRMDAAGNEQELYASTGGRPLGMMFDTSGNLLVADALKGLLSVAQGGRTEVLVKSGAGEPLTFPNALVVAKSGKVYVTDSSTRFSPARWGTTQEAALLEVLEQSASGRVLEYDPATRRTRVVATGLSLANGIALSSDERSLFVSESGRYRVWKLDASADQLDLAHPPAQLRPFLDNLPGYPDNLTRGADGKIWLGLAGQRNELDLMAEKPFMRALTLRIPRFMWSLPKAYGHVIAFTEDGRIVASLQDPTGASPTTTGVTETSRGLYIHNVDGRSLGWLGRKAM